MMLSIIIPVYNGEKTVSLLFERINSFCINQNLSCEVIFVWDFGPDKSWEVISELKKQNSSKVRSIRLSRNFGQHNALICGIKYARGDFIITMDEDLQHNPDDIINLLNKQLENDYDLIYGKHTTLKHAWFRRITSVMLKKLIYIGIPDLHPDYSAFRLIKADIAKKCLEMNNSYTFLDGYLSWVTTHTASVEIPHSERAYGQSSYTIKKLYNHALNIFFTFSNTPVRLITIMSFVIFIFSALYSIYLIIRKIFFDDLISGYASTMVIIGFGIGLIVFSLGIIGEYIYRINLKTTKRPSFNEKEVL